MCGFTAAVFYFEVMYMVRYLPFCLNIYQFDDWFILYIIIRTMVVLREVTRFSISADHIRQRGREVRH